MIVPSLRQSRLSLQLSEEAKSRSLIWAIALGGTLVLLGSLASPFLFPASFASAANMDLRPFLFAW